MSDTGAGVESRSVHQKQAHIALPLPPLPPAAALRWRSDAPGHIEITGVCLPMGRAVRRVAIILGVWLGIAAVLVWLFPRAGNSDDLGIVWLFALTWVIAAGISIAWLLQLRHPSSCGVMDGELWIAPGGCRDPKRRRRSWPVGCIRRVSDARVCYEADGRWRSRSLQLIADPAVNAWITAALSRHLNLPELPDEFTAPPPATDDGSTISYSIAPTRDIISDPAPLAWMEPTLDREDLPGGVRWTIRRVPLTRHREDVLAFFILVGVGAAMAHWMTGMWPIVIGQGLVLLGLWLAALSWWQSRKRVSVEVWPGRALIRVRTPLRERRKEITSAGYPSIWATTSQIHAQTADGSTAVLLADESLANVKHLTAAIVAALEIVPVAAPAERALVPMGEPVPLPAPAPPPGPWMALDFRSQDDWTLIRNPQRGHLILPLTALLPGLAMLGAVVHFAGIGALSVPLFGWVLVLLYFQSWLLSGLCTTTLHWNGERLHLDLRSLFGRQLIDLDRWAIHQLQISPYARGSHAKASLAIARRSGGLPVKLFVDLPEPHARWAAAWIASSLGLTTPLKPSGNVLFDPPADNYL
jgi:hypothetical protein